MQSTLKKTLVVLGELCVFKGRVADLPYSVGTVVSLLVIASALLVEQYHVVTHFPVWQLTLAVIAHFVLLVGAFYWLLHSRHKSNRLYKLLMAFLGTQLLFLSVMGLLVLGVEGEALVAVQSIIGIWEIAVQGTILKQVLEIKLSIAILWLIGLGFVTALPLLPFIAALLPKAANP